MSVPEVAGRARQQASKWLDRATATGPDARIRPLATDDLSPEAQTIAGRHGAIRQRLSSAQLNALLDQFRRQPPSHFFEGALETDTPDLIARLLPEARSAVLDAADQLRRRQFDLLGYRGLSFGSPIDWHLDPVSGTRIPLRHWTRLNPLETEVAGDSKVVWELNRHQWLVRLAQAYRFTQDESYAEVCARTLSEWIDANPPGLGINWTSSLEMAFRLIAWAWTLVLIRRSRALTPELFGRLLVSVRQQASHVARYLSFYFSPNTHLTGEALGLFYAGIAFPQLRQAPRWRALGARILIEESDRQVLPDGVYFEQSTGYQRYTLEFYLHLLMLADRAGVQIPASVEDRVNRMLDFLLAVRRPDGSIPAMGDWDDGQLLPLGVRAADDYRGVFSTAAVVLGRSDCAWAGEGPTIESLWLAGRSGLDRLRRLVPAPPATSSPRIFPDGGYVVMRTGWGRGAHHLIFDVGPLGCPVTSGHGHADLLSIQCSAFGEPFIVDPGTGCYTADAARRAYFRGTSAHSTVAIDDVGQAVPDGPFTWHQRPRARLTGATSGKGIELVEGLHEGYHRLGEPVTHRRRIAFVRSRYWVVIDDLLGHERHAIDVRFQFARLPVELDSDRVWARARGQTGRALLVRSFSAAPLVAAVLQGQTDPLAGWVSTGYGRWVPAPVLIYSTTTELPCRIVTLIWPAEHVREPPPRVLARVGPDSQLSTLAWANTREALSFDDDGVRLMSH
ncbi:MAG TPA: alginate lyase family protein [Vicinamibacterales bacterium]|jgi:hypothetical protein